MPADIEVMEYVQCSTIADAEEHAVEFLSEQLRSYSSQFWQIILQGNPAQEFSLGVGGAGDANKAMARLYSHGAHSKFKRYLCDARAPSGMALIGWYWIRF